jgi:hypothetical protein
MHPTLIRRPLARREKLFLAVGGAAVLAFLVYMLPAGSEEAGVELARAPAASPAPVPPPVGSAPAAAPAPPAAPAASPDGLALTGVFGGGPRGGSVIFRPASGQERKVPIGREVVPGLALKSVGLSHAVLAGTGGALRFEIGRSGASPTPDPATVPAPVPQRSESASLQRETIEYRLGLQPVQASGRVAGYALKPGASLPRLQQAGLKAGDVIVAVNGSRFDEERMLELSWQASNSASTEVEFIRNGKRMKVNISGR